MPSINRIRVNNVKYNFGTQYYDDFTMRLYGRNTLYDLANGGGKSVLMLLLMQNLLPNCTLDDKQPIEKLFRTGSGNTTIHSLVEWKLDPSDIREGYRYMTTGFCARKAKDEAGEGERNVAQIEYFNYCIFYRQYNKNDIINLPLIKDGERISYQALRNYLKELEHRDNSLMVRVFDRKGEYQRFISGYGLHESQWEIVRGINKTEGHVRTYFETNYRTGRKVVEDLLIEEIIEKAFLVKTEQDENENDVMAKLLVNIREQLSLLASKKKDIAVFDHEIELINLLIDRVDSFTDIFKKQSELTEHIANICTTGAEFVQASERRRDELKRLSDEKREEKERLQGRIECLKVSRDIVNEKLLESYIAEKEAKRQKIVANIADFERLINYRQASNEFLEYIEEKKKYDSYLLEEDMSSEELSGEEFNILINSIRIRIDDLIKLEKEKQEMFLLELDKAKAEALQYEKEITEARVLTAVSDSDRDRLIVLKKEALRKLQEISSLLMDNSFLDAKTKIKNSEEMLCEKKKEREALLESIKENEGKIEETTSLYEEADREITVLNAEKSALAEDLETFRNASKKLDSIYTIYMGETSGNKDYTKLKDTVSKKITDSVIDCYQRGKEIKTEEKRLKALKENILIDTSKAASKVIEYIQTRHGGFAMHGMDYLSALSTERVSELLSNNPELPYGVVVKDYKKLKDDDTLLGLNTGADSVIMYDMDSLMEKAVIITGNASFIHLNQEFFVDEAKKEKLIKDTELRITEMKEALLMKQNTEEVMREDLSFIMTYGDVRFTNAEEKRRNITVNLTLFENKRDNAKKENDKLMGEALKLGEKLELVEADIDILETDIERLKKISEISDEVSELDKDIIAAEKSKQEAAGHVEKKDKDLQEVKRVIADIEENTQVSLRNVEKLDKKWNEKYSVYYKEEETRDTTYDLEKLEAIFASHMSKSSISEDYVRDRMALMDTLRNSMNRILKGIARRGISVDELSLGYNEGRLAVTSDKALDNLNKGITEEKEKLQKLDKVVKEKQDEKNMILGSISYAKKNIEAAYGRFEEIKLTDEELLAKLEETQTVLKRVSYEAEEGQSNLKKYDKNYESMLLLYKDAKRIAERNEIDLDSGVVLEKTEDELRDMFEDILIDYDKSQKRMDKARAELLRFKSQTAETLLDMDCHELSQTIRDDVTVPVTYQDTVDLLDNLSHITGYIALEKEQVEKSLCDMELLKANFEEQCLQRCLDIKTELDKLEKLSRINLDNEMIQMVGLKIPYVKEEFMKERMSVYIEKVVNEADMIKDDRERMKYIRNSLLLKKLFGVIVTDMNQVKLSLYKRERIKEQSRYLKYEEAVGSTGQSQGIYIQFLIAIINYISGMYSQTNDDKRTNTIFIDNPFGAAKDIYIWEPIFAMLKENRVQLIVPARGATPAITGRFDVNYVLGQRMVGKKQMTVVVNYQSKTNQEELEYHELNFEQATFDFI